MALGLNKIILAGAVTNTPGAYWQITSVAATTAGNVIPAGTYLAFATSNVFITAVSATNATTGNASAVSNVITINNGGVIISDGVNVFANATTNTTLNLVTVDGGQNVSGTYNAS